MTDLHKDDIHRVSERVPSHTAIQKDQQAMDIFNAMQNDVDEIKKLIVAHVPEKRVHEFVLILIGFFATVKPKVAEELLWLIRAWDGEKFVNIAYQHLYDALEERKKHLLIEDMWTLANPGKQAVDNAIKTLRMLEGFLKPWSVWRWQVPTVPAGLVSREWLSIN